MESTRLLRAEHAAIERVLTLLERAVNVIRGGGTVPHGFVDWVLDFLCHFADGCHHAKEEQVLFPLLEQHGVPRQGGPIGYMLHEHSLGRDQVRRMGDAARAGDWPAFADAAEAYLHLLNQHIQKENDVLYPIAESCLSAAEDGYAVMQFQAAEEENGRRAHDCFVRAIDRWELIMQEQVPPAASRCSLVEY